MVRSALLLSIAIAVAPAAAAARQHEARVAAPDPYLLESWIPGLGGPEGFEGTVRCVESVPADAGGSPLLYVGGSFDSAFGVEAANVVLWDAATWSPLGEGIAGANPRVQALAVFDAGDGPALYVGGEYSSAGGIPADGLARWKDGQWQAVGGWAGGAVSALTVWDDGSGPTLVVGGAFDAAGAGPVANIAAWDGSRWSPLGAGVDGPVWALEVHDDGSGAALYVGGAFTAAGGQASGHIARWDGARWSALGAGVRDRVRALRSGGAGSSLYAAGDLEGAGGLAAHHVAHWDGSSWRTLEASLDGTVLGLGLVEDPLVLGADPGSPALLVVCGTFRSAGGSPARGVAMWDGTSWSALGAGLQGHVHVAAVHDDGSGPALLCGGKFDRSGHTAVRSLARYTPAVWTSVERRPHGPQHWVETLDVVELGGSPKLLVSGYANGGGDFFDGAGTVYSPGLVAWDGTKWSDVGGGLFFGMAHAFATFDEGAGPSLFVGGDLYAGPPGEEIRLLARWDGRRWSQVGAGFSTLTYLVSDLAVHDDGTGAALYAAGELRDATGGHIIGVARWDGQHWVPLGAGLPHPSYVQELELYDDGTGEVLVAAGGFDQAGGVPARNIATWDGSTWAALGAGLEWGALSLGVLPGAPGEAPRLVAGGPPGSPGGTAHNLMAWNGHSWQPLSDGVDGMVRALKGIDEPRLGFRTLFVGGTFPRLPESGDAFLARWGPAGAGMRACAGDGSGTACPCGNESPPEELGGCANSTGGGASLQAFGWPHVGDGAIELLARGLPAESGLFLDSELLAPGGAGRLFGDGLRCCVGTVRRLEMARPAPPAPAAVKSAPIRGEDLHPGEPRCYQYWYRDPAPNGACGYGFNATNAVWVTWH